MQQPKFVVDETEPDTYRFPATGELPRPRTSVGGRVALSFDGGRTWEGGRLQGDGTVLLESGKRADPTARKTLFRVENRAMARRRKREARSVEAQRWP